MFSKAYAKATQFTKPLVASLRYFDGTVESSCAAFIVLNSEGWAITAAHALETQFAFEEHQKQLANYTKEVEAIQSESGLNDKQKRKKMGKLDPKREWIVEHSFWWGQDGVTAAEIQFHPTADLALVKLTGLDSSVATFPVFKNPETFSVGSSLCKLGFPFHYIPSTYEDGKFVLQEGALPIPFFPMEGMYTRTIISRDGETQRPQFIETSTPGLRGQSGGPIFDIEGNIWALQSLTQHYPLGFSPQLRDTVEHQFLNVGWGIHGQVILDFLKEKNVTVATI